MLSMSRHIRVTALASLIAFTSASCGGHSGWVAADPTDIEQSPVDWVGQKLRIHTKEKVYDVYVTEVDPPFVIGYDYVNGFHPSAKVDLRDVVRVERYSDAATVRNMGIASLWIIVPAVIFAFAFITAYD